MKTAIYIEDGTVQLVITPETEFEKNAIKAFSSKDIKVNIFEGSFYDCRGGWVKQSDYFAQLSAYHGAGNNDRSLIIRVSDEEK